MPLLMENDLLLNDKVLTKYIKTQFKILKKNKTNVNSNETLDKLLGLLRIHYNIRVINNTLFAIKLEDINEYYPIKDNIQTLINDCYGSIDVNLLFKFSIIDGDLIVKKKKVT